jgi:hypothetical protein
MTSNYEKYDIKYKLVIILIKYVFLTSVIEFLKYVFNRFIHENDFSGVDVDTGIVHNIFNSWWIFGKIDCLHRRKASMAALGFLLSAFSFDCHILNSAITIWMSESR